MRTAHHGHVRRVAGWALCAALALLFLGCAGSPTSGPSAAAEPTAEPTAEPARAGAAASEVLDVDQAIHAVATDVVRELEGGAERTVVVSYFTEDGEVSGISEYLIGDLTTTLANLGKGTVKVVSRQVLDRLLEEISFQGSDLADEEGQIQVGRQLGADLVLTGFIAPGGSDGRYRLNAQLVEVATGVVVTGIILDFRASGELARKLEPESSETVLLSRQRVEVAGAGTVTTILEDFDRGPPEIQLERYEDRWGERVLDSGGDVELVSEGSADGSAYIRFDHRASLDSDDLLSAWRDSGLRFVSRIAPSQAIGGYDGLALTLKAEGFQMAAMYIKQSMPDREMWFYLTLPLDPGAWTDYRIPFSAFEPSDLGDKLDPALPVAVDISVAYDENWYAYAFRTGTEIECRLSVDNVGYYRQKSPDDPRVLATFDDEVDRMPFSAYVYGTSVYTDYRFSDEGVARLNPGLSGQAIRALKREPGASGTGRYLALQTTLDLTGEIGRFFDEEQGITLYMTSPLTATPVGATGLSFYIRSDLVTQGQLELYDWAHERGYAFEFRVTGFWTRVRVPFASWAGEQGSLADALAAGVTPLTGRARLQLAFDLPREPLLRAGSGELAFEVGLDDLVWER